MDSLAPGAEAWHDDGMTTTPRILNNAKDVVLATNCYHVLVTPELAEELLANNQHNETRLFGHGGPRRVEQYARDMRLGNWRNTSEALALGSDGAILNGQNRLRAVIESGMAVWMRIWVDEDPRGFMVLDTAQPRKSLHYIPAKHKGYRMAGAAVLAVLDGSTDARTIQYGWRPTDATNMNTVESYHRWPEIDLYMDRVMLAHRRTFVNPSAHVVTVCMAARTSHRGMLDDWFEGIIEGAGLEARDPRLQLRNRFMRDHKSLSSSSRHIGAGLVIKAWNAFALGQQMGRLQMGQTETLPSVAGWTPDRISRLTVVGEA